MSRRPLIPIVTGIPLAIIAIFVIASRWIVPNATRQDIMTGVTSPGTAGHLFGTDQLGRDVLSNIIAGARTTLLAALLATAIAAGSVANRVIMLVTCRCCINSAARNRS